jgi:hypothetical protein
MKVGFNGFDLKQQNESYSRNPIWYIEKVLNVRHGFSHWFLRSFGILRCKTAIGIAKT